MDQAEREMLSVLCKELPVLRAYYADQPPKYRHQLARVEQAAAARMPVCGLVAELLGSTSTTGETLKEQRSTATGLPGAGGGRADDEVFGCPDDACSYRKRTVPAGAPPRCEVTGRRMRRL